MATASNTQRPPRDIVEFALNVPVTVALKYGQGKIISSQYGERVMFTTVDNRVMFLDPATAGMIESAGINVRESFTITQKWDGVKGNSRAWEVEKLGVRSDGTFAVPAPPASAPGPIALGDPAVSPKPPLTAAHAVPTETRNALVKEADALVDAFAQVLERALTTYQGRIKPDEVRSLLLSAYIQRRQLSTCA